MKTKITSLTFAIALLLSSCAKEHFNFTNTGTSYGSKKSQSEVAAATPEQADIAETVIFEAEPTKASESLTASTEKTVTLPKKDFTKAKPLYKAPIAINTQKQNVSKFAQAKTALKVKREVKAIVKQAEKNNAPNATAEGEGKSQIIAAVLAFFVGWLGVHRFYLGYPGIGIAQLLTLGGCGIWSLIDLIRIVIDDLKPKDGGDYTNKF